MKETLILSRSKCSINLELENGCMEGGMFYESATNNKRIVD